MTMPDDLAHDISVCIHRDAIVPKAIAIWGDAPVTVRALRRLDDGSLRSAIVTLAAGWSSPSPLAVAAVQQFALLSGRIRFGDRELGPDAFVVVPAGGAMPVIEAIEPSELILIQDPGQAYRPVAAASGAIVTADVSAIEPFTPVIDGEPLHGFERRVLWLDPQTGADTRLLRVPAGFRGGGPNWHPVQEEIFCLEGDIQPDATRPMRAGSYLWNPARSIHGFDEVTRGGCVLLEWHDGPWDLHRA